MSESKSITVLPTAEAVARAAKRFALSLPLIEKSAAALLGVEAGPLPEHRDAVTCRVVGILPTELNGFDSVGVELELIGRDSRFDELAYEFGRIAAYMPVVGGQRGNVLFGLVEAVSSASFEVVQHHGIRKLQAVQRFTANVELTGTVFTPDITPDSAIPPIDANRLTAALIGYLRTADGIVAEYCRRERWCDGISVAVTEGEGERFRFRLTAELAAGDSRLAAFAALASSLPRENVTLFPDVAALALVLAEPLNVTRSARRADRVRATLALDLFADRRTLALGGVTPPVEAVPPVLPDPVVLERKLTELLAIELNLEVNQSLWRGGLPPGHDGCAVILTGTGETDGVFNYRFAIQLRDRRRDVVLSHLANLAERFPRYGLWDSLDYRLTESHVGAIAEDGRGKTEAELTTVMRFVANGIGA